MVSQFLVFISPSSFVPIPIIFSEIIRISALMAHILTLPWKHNRSYIAFIVGLNFSSHNDSRYSFTLIFSGPIFHNRGFPLTGSAGAFLTGITPRKAVAC